jgi:hypothetical protein
MLALTSPTVVSRIKVKSEGVGVKTIAASITITTTTIIIIIMFIVYYYEYYYYYHVDRCHYFYYHSLVNFLSPIPPASLSMLRCQR